MSDAAPTRSRTLLRLFGLAFVTAFSGAIMPGPLLAAVIGQTAAQGFRAVIGLVTGHMLLEVVTVGLLIGGLQAFIQRPRVRGFIGLVGGVALIWMGWDMIAHAHLTKIELAAAGDAYSWGKMLLWGAAVCAVNPYFTGWWATVGVGQLAHMAPKTPAEYAAFFFGHEAGDYIWYSFVGLLIVSGRGLLLQNQSIYHGLIYGCGVLIILVALWFIYTGIRFVSGQAGTDDPPAAVEAE